MGTTNRKKNAQAAAVMLTLLLSACTHHVQIEPSDKPFIVNLNVKIDHDIRVKVEDQNKDLLNLENEVTQVKKSKKGK